MSACVRVDAETANVQLNRAGSMKSAGSAAGTLPAVSFSQRGLSHWRTTSTALMIQQRAFNSEMTRAELKSGSFATGDTANLDNESAE